MPQLPRPDLPAGAHRDLVAELHELHHRAGWPSLRALATSAGCSPTTVSAAFSGPRLPSWGLLELLVEAMTGDVDRFRELWLAAGTSTDVAPRSRLAGRVRELETVRRALVRPGLLLVEGEAGIGKSALVAAATSDLSSGTGRLVALGGGLALTSAVPLMPVTDALRHLLDGPGEGTVRSALANVPSYVAAVAADLLPELAGPVVREARWSPETLARLRLPALVTLLEAVAGRGPTSIVLEDLHWADPSTLELLEYLLVRGAAVPVVGTWRWDGTVGGPTEEWRSRVASRPGASFLTLGPLSRTETRSQLTDLGSRPPSEGDVDRVFAKSGGHPLFTELLAGADGRDPWPAALDELLDRRLDGLDAAQWRVVVALAMADRPLPEDVLAVVTGSGSEDLATLVRALRRRRLVTEADEQVALHHLLVGEAVRRRTSGGERAAEHRRLARALAAQPDPWPAEVAEHWDAAGDVDEELVWRLRAARDATDRLAVPEARRQWERAWELWPANAATAGDPPLRRVRALEAVLDTLPDREVERALVVAEACEAHLAELTEDEVALLYQRKADLLGAVHRLPEALGYLGWALRMYERQGVSADHVDALERLEGLLAGCGDLPRAGEAAAQALALSRQLADPARTRHLLGLHAWHRAAAGDRSGARDLMRQAMSVEVAGDPIGDVELAADLTDLLLRVGASCDRVLEVGRQGLEQADRWGLETYGTMVVRANMGLALLRAGDPRAAAETVIADVARPPDPDNWAAHLVLVGCETAADRLDEAMARADLLQGAALARLSSRAEVARAAAEAALWAGRPARALELTSALLTGVTESADADAGWLLLLVAARARADLALSGDGDGLPPFRLPPRGGADAAVPAQRATIEAELLRAQGSDPAEAWLAAAAHWDRLSRPHEAAYARWRAGRAQEREGRPDLASRLFRRAARDARTHLPLAAAVRAAAEALASGPTLHT